MAAGGLGCSHTQPPPAEPAPVASSEPPPRPPAPKREEPQPAPTKSTDGLSDGSIYFDFDSYLIRDDARDKLVKVAEAVKADRSKRVRIEGNCDELGTVEYNMALGEQRAKAAEQYLQKLGVPGARITTVSYGSQRPRATGHDDSAHAENRRDDFRLD